MTLTNAVPAPTVREAPQSINRIGPNAITQVFDVIADVAGEKALRRIAKQAQLANYIDQRPSTMVDERHIVRLHQTVRKSFNAKLADQVLFEAGERTARYILANRIPQAAQFVLKAMPARLACPLLARAIAHHAWTFAGSGTFSFSGIKPTTLSLINCPACFDVYAPDEPCHYYMATLEGLFQKLVHPRANIVQSMTVEQKMQTANGRDRTFILDW